MMLLSYKHARLVEQIQRIDPGVAETLYLRYQNRRPQIGLWLDQARQELVQINSELTNIISQLNQHQKQENWPKDENNNPVYPAEEIAALEGAKARLEGSKAEVLSIIADLENEADMIDIAQPYLQDIVAQLEEERKKEPEVYGDDDEHGIIQG